MFGMSPEGYRALRQIEARAREARSRAERRDRFAMAALTGAMTSASGLGDVSAEVRLEALTGLAEVLYEVADAMEAARNKEDRE